MKKLTEDLKCTIDSKNCIKLRETAEQKVNRDSLKGGGVKECFGKLKDIIRCRTTVYNLNQMIELIEYFQDNFNVLQIKNGLDRKQVPTV